MIEDQDESKVVNQNKIQITNQSDEKSNRSEPFDQFVDRWLSRFLPESESAPPPAAIAVRKFQPFIFFLKMLPWFTLLVFFISLKFDFSGQWLPPWRDEPISIEGIIRMFAVTGLVGFGTNYIAIKMLFYPRKRRPLLGQGLIPMSKQKIARKLGESISKEIINSELIVKQVKSQGLIRKHMERFNQSVKDTLSMPEFRDDLYRLIEHYLNRIVHSEEFRERVRDLVQSFDFENLGGIEAGLLKVYRFMGGDKAIANRILDAIDSMNLSLSHREPILNAYLEMLPNWIEDNELVVEDLILNTVTFLVEKINIRQVVTENLESFDELRLERLLLYSTSDQLDYIQYLGCLLGILGGFFIWMPVESFVVFGIFGISLFSIDAWLVYLRRNR